MHVAVLILMIAVVCALVYLIFRLGRSDYNQLANSMAKRSRESFEVLRPCPLCGKMLRRGETVHSVVFSGGQEGYATDDTGSRRGRSRPTDSLAHLFGCPYCYPANGENRRICPVCRKEISAEGYVIARMFEKPGKKHVHVLGCTQCRERRKP